MKYFCLCDLDGTLLNDKNEIDEKSINIIRSLKDIVKIIVVSKSSYQKLIALKDKYNIDIDIFSSLSKLAIINNKTFYNLLPEKLINDILVKFNESIYTAYGEGLSNNFIYKFQERLISLYPKTYSANPQSLLSLNISIYNEAYDSLVRYLKENNIFYEVIMKDYKKALISISILPFNKGYAYTLAKKEYGCLAIGITDSIVDKEMLEPCNLKIAMLNGDLEIKDYCQTITTEDNNNQGAMKSILTLL